MEEQTFVLDTKWKIPDISHPDDGNLKQLNAYSLQFNAQEVILVYPSPTETFAITSGSFSAAELHETRTVAQ